MSKGKMQRYMFGAKKLRAQSVTVQTETETDVSILTLFPMVLSFNDLPP